jgi:hypothetical protein
MIGWWGLLAFAPCRPEGLGEYISYNWPLGAGPLDPPDDLEHERLKQPADGKTPTGCVERDKGPMRSQFALKPGIGIGDVKFGASRDEVRRLLGEPKEEETFDSCEKGDIRWYYPSLQLNIYFGIDDALRVDSFETTHGDMRIWGSEIIGIGVTELLQLFKQHHGELPEIIDGSYGELLYSFHDCGCNVYVEEEVVASIQLGVLFDEAGDNVRWPD